MDDNGQGVVLKLAINIGVAVQMLALSLLVGLPDEKWLTIGPEHA